MKSRWPRRLAGLLVFFRLCWSAGAMPLAVGDRVPVFSAADQHGQAYGFTNGPAFLLVAKDRGASQLANQKLAEKGAGFLESRHAIYVLDIHAMPAIARLFALPKMRKYPQRMILIEAAETLAPFPSQAERVTVLTLSPERKIQTIRFWNPATEPVVGILK